MSDANPGDGLAGLSGVVEAAKAAGERGPPPVHLWNPPGCGDIDIRIAADGTWFHEGSPIGREPLVKLFASILRLDPDGYYLVTPVEKMRIRVDDAPFIAVRVDKVGEALRFLTNVGDVVEAGSGHDLRVTIDPRTDEPRPYVHVRRGLEARLTRPVFYEIVEWAQPRETPAGLVYAVASKGEWYPVTAPTARP